MESLKRKRKSDGNSDASAQRLPPPPPARGAPAPEEDDRVVTDEEVEEFFGILTRMHEASRCLTAGPRSVPAPLPPRVAAAAARSFVDNRTVAGWSPTFAWEDFARPQKVTKNDDGRRIGGDGEDGQLPMAPPAAAMPAEDGEAVAQNATTQFFDLNVIPEEFDGFPPASPCGEDTARCARLRA